MYGLQSKDLKNLSPDTAIDFFRRVLWAESVRVGVSKHLIDAPDCVNVGDGGLDIVIENAVPTSEDVIPRGLSGFQIKSSDLSPSECRKELHQNGSLENLLKPGIRRVLDNNGTYILVLFEEMPHETMKKDREEAIKEEFGQMGYASAQIRVYTINQIISFAERYPALVAWLKDYGIECLPFQEWAKNADVNAPKTFVVDDQRRGIIEKIREELRGRNGKTPILRITGLPGLGKTRLVFESLAFDDLKNKVIYVTAEGFKDSNLLNMLLIDNKIEAIVVIDECPLDNHEYFSRRFGNRGSRLSLITISNEMGNAPPPSLCYELGPLPEDGIEKLLSEEMEGLPRNVTDRLAQFADGYPRIAMLLAESYLSKPSTQEDILNINDENLIAKLIAGRLDPTSELHRKTKKVLMGLSLFEKVGYEKNLCSEAKWVAAFIEVSWSDFQQIVAEQKRRGIVRGEYYVYVTPFHLAVYLAREWWNTYGNSADFGKFNELPTGSKTDMWNRFTSHFPFIASTEPGKRLVEEMLSEGGIFADGLVLNTEKGAALFLKLTEADPESALDCLKRSIGTWSKDQLLELKTGRRGVVWSLEKIAVWKELFADAARLLLALGEAENEDYANNASGVFANLFSPAWGSVAPSEASPEDKFSILVDAINSDSIERKKLALRAFRSALQWGHFTRTVGAEYQGGKPIPKLWIPKSGKELLDHYQRTWSYLEENLEKFEGEVRDGAVELLLDSTRSMVSIHPSLSEQARKTLRKMAFYPWVDKGKLIETVSKIVHYDGKRMQETTLKDWTDSREELTGSSFCNLLRRYVGMDLLEDYFQTGEKYDTKWLESKIQELAEKAVESPDILESEYSWLTTKRAKRGHQFGYALGKTDKDFLLLDRLVEEQKKTASDRGVNFLGGYFRALFEKNTPLWEDKLDAFSTDPSFMQMIPGLTWCSGMTDKAAERILLMAERGDIKAGSFSTFRFGGVVKQISESALSEWIKFLLKESTGLGALITLDFIHFYYVFRESRVLPRDLALGLLLHPVFWNNPNDVSRDRMTSYTWKEVATRVISTFPETADAIAEQIIKFLGDERSVAGFIYSETQEVLLEIAKRRTEELWVMITKYLDPQTNTRVFYLAKWLKGGTHFDKTQGALELFDPNSIWKWVDENEEKRAYLLTIFVPTRLFRSKEKICLARELLVRYGNREDIRSRFTANYFTEGWVGAASEHYMTKKQQLMEFRSGENDPNVIKWIEENIAILEKDIEKAKMEEEKRGF